LQRNMNKTCFYLQHVGNKVGEATHNLPWKTACRDPGSNRGPSDLQSDALPTELSRLADHLWEDSVSNDFLLERNRCHLLFFSSVKILRHPASNCLCCLA
jgi:hypothetical protein